jgi:alpha-glucosidase
MQWDRTLHSGFSNAEPWLPVEEGFKARNVADQIGERRSALSLNRALISLRNRHDALSIGQQRIVDSRDDVLLLERSHGSESLLVALNFSHEGRQLPWLAGHEIVLSTHMDRNVKYDGVSRADEGLILRDATSRTRCV